MICIFTQPLHLLTYLLIIIKFFFTGQPGSKMAAALSHAMVTATLPVARPAPAALPGQNPSKALPNIHSNLKSGWQKQRNITVIEEVSA